MFLNQKKFLNSKFFEEEGTEGLDSTPLSIEWSKARTHGSTRECLTQLYCSNQCSLNDVSRHLSVTQILIFGNARNLVQSVCGFGQKLIS